MGYAHIRNLKNNRGMTDMKKITLYIGLNDKDSKVQQISTIEAERIVCNRARSGIAWSFKDITSIPKTET